MPWITTKTGKRVNTDWFDEDEKRKQAQIEANKEEAHKKNNPNAMHKKQVDYEERIRNSKTEKGAYFDKDGNVVLEASGNAEFVEFEDKPEFNHKVEQAVWNGAELHFTHNHPENTIFSPEDVEELIQVENKSLSAVLINGTTYRLIREQPISENVMIDWDYKNDKPIYKKDYTSEFNPKDLAPAYRAEYDKLYDNDYKKMRATTIYGSPERKKATEALDAKVSEGMEKWLKKNASRYGFTFIKE